MATLARVTVLSLGTTCVAAMLWVATPRAQTTASPARAGETSTRGAEDSGIPVTDAAVRAACQSCHPADDQQRLTRISFRRTTPEGWERTITRMMALNGATLDPETARRAVKYLSNSHGLAPEEARPTLYEVERRLVDEPDKPKELTGTCDACHTLGRILSQRRTKPEWELLIAMHRGFYPIIDRQTYRRLGPAPRDRDQEGRLPDTRHPSERAIDHLARTFPLQTKAWAEWSAAMRPARLEGTWALSGWEPGRGRVFGRLTLEPVVGTTDEFTSKIAFTYARSGQQVVRAGRVTIYTGFQWRGRSTVEGAADSALREVMFVERDWSRIEGRWFSGGYDEQGLDVTLTRVGQDVLLSGVDPQAVRAGTSGQVVKVHAANVPSSLRPTDFDFGSGITISSLSVSGDVVTVTLDVAQGASVGPRALGLGRAVLPVALTVYDRIDSIRVAPQWNMARTGGVVFPKQYATFDAWAYHNGADKKPGTADDLRLDSVPATWSLEEYTATFGDEDLKFVGAIDATSGLFTPNVDGPNPERKGERNNIGDVWVVATYTPPGSSSPLRARSHLLVAPPLYIKFDPTVTP